MNTSHFLSPDIEMNTFRLPKIVFGGFIAKRTLRGALLWAVVFGGYFASKSLGLASIYPTAAERLKIAHSYGTNIGIEFIIGSAKHVTSTAASIGAWNTLGIMVITGSIWGLLLSTKYFRGEEDAGRSEIVLAGETTPRQAAANVFGGLAASLSVFYIVVSLLFIAVGKSSKVDYSVSSALFFGLAALSSVVIFVMVGALASQLMPTRGKAASLSAEVFGVFFIMRAIADITSAKWLLNFTPLGWIEKLQPLSGNQPIWLLPIVILILILGALTIFFVGRRDIGEGIFVDRDSSKPRTRLLNSPLGAAFRLTRINSISWLVGIFATSVLYGLLTKSAAQEFDQSSKAAHVLGRLAHQSQQTGATVFLGVIFLLMMTVIMGYAASAIASIRNDEANNYLDNFLVQPVSRIKWLNGRLLLDSSVVILAGLLTLFGTWLGAASQHTGVSFHSLLLASINALVPAVFTIGAAIFVFGVYPRITSLIAYAVLGWSFLLVMLSSGLHINHWILDTSVLNHIALAPATSPRWTTDLIIIVLSLALYLFGLIAFNKRDLQTE